MATYQFVPEISCEIMQQLGVYREAQQKGAPRLTALSHHLCSYASKQGSSMVTTRSLTPGEVTPPLPNTLQAGELPLPIVPRGSLDHTLLPHQSTGKAARHCPGNVTDL